MGTPAAASGKGQSFFLLAGGPVGGQPAQPGGSRAPRSGSRELSPAERGPGEGALWVPHYLENTLRAVGGLPRAASRNRGGRSRKDPPLGSAAAPLHRFRLLLLPSLPLSPVRRAQRVPATVSQPPVLSATRLWPPTRCSTESQDPPLGGRCWEAAAWTEPTHCSGTSENRERGLKPCSRPAARRRKSSVSNPHRPGQPAGRLQRRAQPPHLSSHWSARRQRALGLRVALEAPWRHTCGETGESNKRPTDQASNGKWFISDRGAKFRSGRLNLSWQPLVLFIVKFPVAYAVIVNE